MKNTHIFKGFLIVLVGFLFTNNVVFASVPTVVNASFTTTSQHSSVLTIIYSEPVITTVSDYTNLSIVGWPTVAFNVSGSGTDTIIIETNIGATTGEDGFVDIGTGVVSVSTGDPIVPIFSQYIADGQAPQICVAPSAGGWGYTNDSLVNVMIPVSELVGSSFDVSDINILNGSISSFSGPAISFQYYIDVIPTLEGPVTISIPDGAATDLVGFLSVPSSCGMAGPGTSGFFVYDITSPTLVSATITSNTTMDLVFNENIGSGIYWRNVSFPNWTTDITATGLTVTGGDQTSSNTITLDISTLSNVPFLASDLMIVAGTVSDYAENFNTLISNFTINDNRVFTTNNSGGGGAILIDMCNNLSGLQNTLPENYVFYENQCLTKEEFNLKTNITKKEEIKNENLLANTANTDLSKNIQTKAKKNTVLVKTKNTKQIAKTKKAIVPANILTASVINSLDTQSEPIKSKKTLWQKIKAIFL